MNVWFLSGNPRQNGGTYLANDDTAIKIQLKHHDGKTTTSFDLIDARNKYDDTIVFILMSVHKKRSYEEIKKEVASQYEEMGRKYPGCKFVLVGTKADKTIGSELSILQHVAEDLKFAGVAIVSALKNTNVLSLFAATVNHLVVAKLSNSAPPSAAKQLHVINYPQNSHTFFSDTDPKDGDKAKERVANQDNMAVERVLQSAGVSPEVLAARQRERDTFIPQIQAHMKTLEEEILRIFAVNKPRKFQKLYALNELLTLTRLFPAVPMSEHVAAIRITYASKDLDKGDPSRTKILLDNIVKFHQQPNPSHAP